MEEPRLPAHRLFTGFVLALLATAPLHAGINRWTRDTPDWGPENVSGVFVHPRNARVVFARGNGLWRSDDGGSTWTLLPLKKDLPLGVAPDPRSERILYIGVPEGGVDRSTDGGWTWEPMSAPGAMRPIVYQLTIGVSAPETLFAYSTNPIGLFRSQNSGATWQLVLPIEHAVAVAIDPADGQTVYAASGNAGVLKSTDGGDTWLPSSAGIAEPASESIAIDAGNSRILSLANGGLLMRSTDAGQTWHATASAATGVREVVSVPGVPGEAFARTTDGVGGIYFTSDTGATWNPVAVPAGTGSIFGLATAPGLAGHLYVAANALLATTDVGGAWQTLGEGQPLIGGQSLAVSPFEPETVYAAGGLQRFSVSVDGGRTWAAPQNDGLDTLGIGGLQAVRSTPEIVYAASPTGAFRTLDRGADWEPVGDPGVPASVVPDPDEAPHFILVTTICNRAGCFGISKRTTDGGATWSAILPPSGFSLFARLLTSTEPQILLATSDTGLVRGNPAETLAPVPDAPGLVTIVADPLVPATIYGVGWSPEGPATRLFRSDDAGEAWTAVGPMPADWLVGLAIHPLEPRIMAVRTLADGVALSTDGGRSWQPFGEGIPEYFVQALAFASDGRTLYAGTGSAVYAYTFCDDCPPRIEPQRTTREIPPRN